MSMSIWRVFFHVINEARVWPAIFTAISVILSLAYMIFQQSVLMQSDLDVYSAILSLGGYTVLERALKALNEIIVTHFIMLPFNLNITRYISEVIAARAPSSLLLMKDNAYVLNNAARVAQQSLVENGLGVITPIVLLISRCAAISMRLDVTQLFIVISCLVSIFLAGSAILAYDHRAKEKLSKQSTKIEEHVRSIMTSVATIVINGMAPMLPTWMKALKMEQAVPSTRHDVIMATMYGLLEMAITGIPVALVWNLKGAGAFLPLYIIIQPMFWNSWYMFCTVKSLVVSTAPWIQFSDFMTLTKPRPPPAELLLPSAASDMMPIFENSTIMEIRLCGCSGCGKSTLMKHIISQICDKFMIGGFILYIDQFGSVPQGMTMEMYFSSAFPSPLSAPISSADCWREGLFTYAKALGIFNIINPVTLQQSFTTTTTTTNISGGEIKRLIFLRYVLPILTGVSKVQIMFLDEVSAGLDEASFCMVRALLEQIKAMGVRVVSIDHHNYDTDLCVDVFKKVVPIYRSRQLLSVAQTLTRKIVQTFFPLRYRNVSDSDSEPDLEMAEPETAIVVWAPALGIEEPNPSPFK
jgi:ABC-type Mn2+/Zn2+ transport system ATPase subunit